MNNRIGCTPKYPPYLLGLIVAMVLVHRRRKKGVR